MRSKVVVGLLMVLVAVFFISSVATAQGSAKLLCVSKKELKGEETVASCMAKGERFAIVDPYGMVRILTPEEVELTKAFTENCKLDRAAYASRFTTPRGKSLLNGFEGAIRRLYGLNLQPAHSKPSRAPRGSKKRADQTSSQGLAESDAQFRVDKQQQDHDDQPPL